MKLAIWEAKLNLDIGLPDELIDGFRRECEKEFGATTDCYYYPPDGQEVESCRDAEKVGQHVTVTIDCFQRRQFCNFLVMFSVEHNLDVSGRELEPLYSV